MARIVDRVHNKLLNELNINISTTYKDGDKIKKDTDNISNGIRIKKEYYKDSKLLGSVTNFDSRIIYTFIKSNQENNFRCPNCGAVTENINEYDSCPYCNTYYNLDYQDKEMGSKYTYDLIVKSDAYLISTFIVDLIITLIFVGIYIFNTSRTFNEYDIFKVIGYGICFALIIFYPLYILDGYVVLLPLRIKKNRSNEQQKLFFNKFTNLGYNIKSLYNNFNYELQNYYYKDKHIPNIIDYDILDYNSFKFIKEDEIEIKITIREVVLNNNKIKFKLRNRKFKLIHIDNTNKLNGGTNIIKCPGCSASIDITTNECSFCGKIFNGYQEWYLKER